MHALEDRQRETLNHQRERPFLRQKIFHSPAPQRKKSQPFFVDGSVSQNHLNVRFNYIENGFFVSPLSLNMNFLVSLKPLIGVHGCLIFSKIENYGGETFFFSPAFRQPGARDFDFDTRAHPHR